MTTPLERAIDAANEAEALVAKFACQELARLITAALPTAVAVLIEADQDSGGQLVACSIVDADENVIWQPNQDPHHLGDVVFDASLAFVLECLDERNVAVWEQAESGDRLIIAHLPNVH